MRQERRALEAVGALSIQDSLNQVKLLQSMQNQQEALASRLEERLQAKLMETLTQYGHMERELEQAQGQQELQVNALTNGYRTDPALLRTLEALSTQVAELHTQGQNGNCNGTPPRGGNHNLPSIKPRTGKPYKRYCWSHGCCNHWSRHCNNKNPGHKNEATLKQRMGGSNYTCLSIATERE